ncbi:MAG: methionine adenosyltransferase, partial [Alphaproteobacteria bacterium]
MQYFFTSESVAPGHPDKVCDQISDAILDAYLTEDPFAHTAIETFVTTDQIIVGGETNGPILSAHRLESIARDVVKRIGYAQDGFHWQTLDFKSFIHPQPEDIAQGVKSNNGNEWGAGDQGIMFGFACDETDMLIPAPIYYAHRILENLQRARTQALSNVLGPDAKSQVTLRYVDGVPQGAQAIVLSTQHSPDADLKSLREKAWAIVESSLPVGWMCAEQNFFFNPTGRFVIGGPAGDCGLTGRKIVVDTYGSAAPHGGGAFSGKDPTKVDRSAAYMLRHIAKNIVAARLAKRCTIQIAYAIGYSKPLSLYVNTHRTGLIPDEELTRFIQNEIDMSPKAICDYLQLNRPIYLPTATYGHFGRQPQQNGCFSWERLELLPLFKSLGH